LEINTAAGWRKEPLKASPLRLTREHARELLAKIDSAIGTTRGKDSRDILVKALNSNVPTYSWVGIYAVDGRDLVLDAWSGPAVTEHARIPIGKGICGFAAKAGRTEIVSDVSRDPRYLQCFPSTKAEIVVPVFKEGAVIGEIDIDSDQLDAFSSLDREFLEALAKKVSDRWSP
jgi:GAF domain-containing protein